MPPAIVNPLNPFDQESQIKLILQYRSRLMNGDGVDLLDVSDLPICANGQPEPGEQCDDGNTESGDGCSSYCTLE